MTSSVIQDNVGTVATQQDLDYTYDFAGNITNITDNVTAADTETYAYDALHRLASAGSAGGAYYPETYAYDAVGNRTERDTLGSPAIVNYTYAAGSNQLLTRQDTSHTSVVTTWTYTHGDSGARATRVAPWGAVHSYTYDDSDRMIEIERGSTTYATFGHNAAGQRVWKVNAYGVALRFVYDLSGQLIAEQASSGGALREYIRLDGMILGFVSGGVLHWIHQDHVGRPRMVASQNGDVQWQTRYEPFGRTIGAGGAVPTELRFPGQYWDWESGLYYNGARDYDHATARYAQSDPIGLGGGWNTYAYVGGNPVMRVDPFGLLEVYIWDFRGVDVWGHASMKLDDGTYISWWPTEPVSAEGCQKCGILGNEIKPLLDILYAGLVFETPAFQDRLFSDDRRDEQMVPDHVIEIQGLDELAIRKWWGEYRQQSLMWQTLRRNCATTVEEALIAGGALELGVDQPLLLFMPNQTRDFANEIAKALK